jgi:hypothetical protein
MPWCSRGGETSDPLVAALSSFLDETIDHFDELMRFVFLKKVACLADRDMRLVSRARNEFVEDPFTTLHDGVLVAEGSEEWLLERLKNIPCSLVFRD